jgi:hypothetical protein
MARLVRLPQRSPIKRGSGCHSGSPWQAPFLFPRLRGWVKPKYPFWPRRCIKREDEKVMFLFSAVVLFDLAQHGFEFSRLPENLTWYCVWAAVMLGYLISRGLRRFTDTFEGIS